jgi:hypothetical protein
MRLRNCVGPIAPILLIACGHDCGGRRDPCPPPLSQPERAELVGTWSPTPDTLELMRDEGHYSVSQHFIRLDDDGTFAMNRMPDWWILMDSDRGYYSGRGTWRLDNPVGPWEILVLFLELNGASDRRAHTFNLTEKKGRLRLCFLAGDGDFGRYMFFLRNKDG